MCYIRRSVVDICVISEGGGWTCAQFFYKCWVTSGLYWVEVSKHQFYILWM